MYGKAVKKDLPLKLDMTVEGAIRLSVHAKLPKKKKGNRLNILIFSSSLLNQELAGIVCRYNARY
jgi:hypothetical protein